MLRFPPRRILVPVDLTKPSLFAWEAAKEISRRFGAELEAVWFVEPEATEAVGLGRRPRFREMGLKRLRAELGPDAKLHAVTGYAARAILRLARGRGCDLIVLGTHRRRGLVRLVEGSVAESVIRGAPCPVLVVPRAWRSPRWILAPVHDAVYARRGLQAAAVAARAYKARLAVLEVVAKPSLAPLTATRLSLRARRLPPALVRDVRPELEVRVGDPVRQILRAERSRDLVVMVAHRKSFLRDLIRGTTVEQVLRRSRLPVLAVPSGGV